MPQPPGGLQRPGRLQGYLLDSILNIATEGKLSTDDEVGLPYPGVDGNGDLRKTQAKDRRPYGHQLQRLARHAQTAAAQGSGWLRELLTCWRLHFATAAERRS
ncbi:unnamed protein product [Urochloa humidicola]